MMFGRGQEQLVELVELKARLLAREAEIVGLKADRDYGRTRAERLTDAALARAGAIHQPTMVEPKPAPAMAVPTGPTDPGSIGTPPPAAAINRRRR